jgi:hypothetical protein
MYIYTYMYMRLYIYIYIYIVYYLFRAPTNPILYANRAMGYLKIGDYALLFEIFYILLVMPLLGRECVLRTHIGSRFL